MTAAKSWRFPWSRTDTVLRLKGLYFYSFFPSPGRLIPGSAGGKFQAVFSAFDCMDRISDVQRTIRLPAAPIGLPAFPG